MNPTDLLFYLNHADDQGLYSQADAVRREVFGKDIFIHAVIQISNICERECRHCSLRKSNKRMKRSRLPAAQVLDLAAAATKDGAGTIVLRSGIDPGCSTQLIGELVREIKSRHDVAVTLSLGHRGIDEYAYWKECGADRCQIGLKTSEPIDFKRLDQGTNFTDRLHLLEGVRSLGYEIGSGVMAGLPGTTIMDSLRDILFLSELSLDMIEIVPFVPRPGTPMSGMGPGSVDTAMRMIALLRIMHPTVCIPAMTALDELRQGSRLLALARGCNAILPSLAALPDRETVDIRSGLDHDKAAIAKTGLTPSPAKGLKTEGQHVG